MRTTIAALIHTIAPYDTLEEQHKQATLCWINSGAPLYRIHKPATPPQHLVAYFAVFDPAQQQLLLVDHRQAELWLPTGGHIEPDEHPQTAVIREAREELGLRARFLLPNPLFLTVTQTVGHSAGHTDVSLWYVLHGDSQQALRYDHSEFLQVTWFPLKQLPYERSDPHLRRFVAKLQQFGATEPEKTPAPRRIRRSSSQLR